MKKMKTELYKRYSNGGSMITDAGMDLFRKFSCGVKDFIAEAEEDGSSVDLRDLQTILNDAVNDTILVEIMSRRLRP
jgi:hypothetical protein